MCINYPKDSSTLTPSMAMGTSWNILTSAKSKFITATPSTFCQVQDQHHVLQIHSHAIG